MAFPVPTGPASGPVARLLPEEFRFLFNDRPTLWFESHQDYDRLLTSLIIQHDPKTITEFIWIRDLADCQWEILRFRRMKTAAIVVEMQDAAWALLEKTFEQHREELKLEPGKASFDEAIRLAAVNSSIAKHQLTELQDYGAVSNEALLYKTFAMSHGTLSALEAALSRAERRRDQLAVEPQQVVP